MIKLGTGNIKATKTVCRIAGVQSLDTTVTSAKDSMALSEFEPNTA